MVVIGESRDSIAARLICGTQTCNGGAFYFQLVMRTANEMQPRLHTGNGITADEFILNARLSLHNLEEQLGEWLAALHDDAPILHDNLCKDYNRASLGFFELDEALRSILYKDLEHKINFRED